MSRHQPFRPLTLVANFSLAYPRTEYTPTFRGFDSFYGFYEGSEESRPRFHETCAPQGKLMTAYVKVSYGQFSSSKESKVARIFSVLVCASQRQNEERRCKAHIKSCLT